MGDALRAARTEAWAVWRAAVLQIRETGRVRTAMVVSVIQPVVLLAVVSRGTASTDPGQATEVVFGCVMIGLWSSTLWGAGTLLRREAAQGTLAALLVRPVSLLSVLLGKTLGVAAAGLVRTLAAVVVAVPVLGLHPQLPRPSAAVLVTVAAVASAAAMGLLLSCVVLLSRAGLRVVEALGYPVFVLGGIVIPPDLLAPVLRWPAQAVSLHHLAALVHDAAHGRAPASVHLAGVLILTVLYLACGVYAFNAVLRRGRVKGTLELA
ncbi:ABC transporter permease [Kitasatospora sp. NPDC058243]|uniref:ABC transporter permease n=1 Tax=Kitasatospora sp. NPDC058243 TaxID=3346397 RepID=UPI0036DB6BA5